jgi:hypothetical protein
MQSSRRDFLKLLGLGAAAALVDPTGRAFIDSPEAAAIARGPDLHLVYDYHGSRGPVLNPDGSALFLFERADGTVEPMGMSNPYRPGFRTKYIQDPLTGRKVPVPPQPWAPSASINAVDYEMDVPVGQGEDPHIAFMMAAHELRDRIAMDTAKLAKGMGSSSVLVTSVFTPLVAMPHATKGMYLHASIGQYVVPNRRDFADEGKPISSIGEVPVEVPNVITMKMLLHMDKELEQMGMLDPDRHKAKKMPRGAVQEAFKRAARKGLLHT